MASTKAEPLTLGIETGIQFIQTQHIGECAYDAIQMTLFFADGFRDLFAQFAETILNQVIYEKDNTKLTVQKLFNLDKLFEETVGIYFGLSAAETYLKAFLARAVRRYILIKLQQGGWTVPHILQKFNLTSLETSCILPFKTRKTALARRPSLNTKAGLTTAESAMKMIGAEVTVEDWELKTRGVALSEANDLWNTLLASVQAPVVLSSKFRKSDVFEAANFEKLVCIYVLSRSESGAHANAILRYRNKFYYCDNEIGIALELSTPLTPDLVMKKDSIIFDFTEYTTRLFINTTEYLRSSISLGATSQFVSFDIFYIYSFEPIALSALNTPITIPPVIEPIVTSPLSYTFSKTMSRAGAYWMGGASQLAAKNATLATRFSKTLRAARNSWNVSTGEAATVGTRKFSRTLRAHKA